MGFVENKIGGLSMPDGRTFKRWNGIPEVGIEYYISLSAGCDVGVSFTSVLKSVILKGWVGGSVCHNEYDLLFENGVEAQMNSGGSSFKGFYVPDGTVGTHQGSW